VSTGHFSITVNLVGQLLKYQGKSPQVGTEVGFPTLLYSVVALSDWIWITKLVFSEKFDSLRNNNYGLLVYIELAISFLIGRKRTVNFGNQRPWRHNCRLYNYHVKDTQGHL